MLVDAPAGIAWVNTARRGALRADISRLLDLGCAGRHEVKSLASLFLFVCHDLRSG